MRTLGWKWWMEKHGKAAGDIAKDDQPGGLGV